MNFTLRYKEHSSPAIPSFQALYKVLVGTDLLSLIITNIVEVIILRKLLDSLTVLYIISATVEKTTTLPQKIK